MHPLMSTSPAATPPPAEQPADLPVLPVLDVAIVADIGDCGDIPPEGRPCLAWAYPAPMYARTGAIQMAHDLPGLPMGVFTFSDAFTTPGTPTDLPFTERRLFECLIAYIENPPADADGRQLNAAVALRNALLAD